MLAIVAERPPRYGPKDVDPIPEKLLARLWEQRAAQQEWFRTAAGSRIRVIYPGREGKAAGPDFRDAILEVEGQGLVRGDVELHVRQKDWHSHGHSQDPNYNGVVLHAALQVDSPATALQSGRETPVVSLAQLLAQSPDPSERKPLGGFPAGMGLWELLDSRGFPRPQSAAEAGALLDFAGDQRFFFKSRRFRLFLVDQVPWDAGNTGNTGDTGDTGAGRPGQAILDQTLYESLMEGLGYKNNQQPFLKLAQRAPWRVLGQKSQSFPPEERAAAVQGWLSAVSGLVAGKGNGAVVEGLPRGLGPALSQREWHLSGLRPANRPLRRMAGAAALVERYSHVGLAASLEAAADRAVQQEARGRGPKALTVCLTVDGGGEMVASIGRDRARELAVNVVLPFLHALPGGGADGYLDLYRRFGKPQENELTREMARLLLDPAWGQLVTSARRQQGLIHLHRVLAG